MGTLNTKLSRYLLTFTLFSSVSGDRDPQKYLISNNLLKTFKNQMEHTDFDTLIIMNETTDIMSKSRLSAILR